MSANGGFEKNLATEAEWLRGMSDGNDRLDETSAMVHAATLLLPQLIFNLFPPFGLGPPIVDTHC